MHNVKTFSKGELTKKNKRFLIMQILLLYSLLGKKLPSMDRIKKKKRKFSPKQIAAQRRFAQMARSGSLARLRKKASRRKR